MKAKKILLLGLMGISFSALADGITQYSLPFGNKLESDGSVQVNLDKVGRSVDKTFYGADTNGFTALPDASVVTPLQLGYVKFGGNLHSTFNWELNAYYDHNIYYVYAPFERRLLLAKEGYHATPMWQVNMLGWQPDKGTNGKLVYANTATAKHAADAITFLNGTKKIGLQNIIMGNEPFDSFDVHNVAIPSADQYIDSYIKYAVAVRSAQEKLTGNSNDIKLWGPEIANGWSGWQTTHPDDCVEDNAVASKYTCSYGNGKFTEFMPYFLSRIAEFEKDSVKNPKHYKMLDYITWHYYPLFRTDFHDNGSIIMNPDGTQNVAGMLESVNLWDSESYINKYDYASPRGVAPSLIKKFSDWRAAYYPNAKLGCTEFGVDSVANIAYHPVVRPLYLADLLGRVAGAGVDVFVNSFLQDGALKSSWSLINGSEKTTLYNLYSLYSNNFVGKILTSTDSYQDMVNAYSVKTATGTNVFLVNKDTVDHVSSVSFKKGEAADEVVSVKIPTWSVVVLSVPDNHSGKILVRQYGAREMGAQLE